MPVQPRSIKRLLSFSFHYWKRRPKSGIALMILMTLATILDSFVPVFAGRVVDAVVANEGQPEIAIDMALINLFIFAGLLLAFDIVRWGSFILWIRFAVRNLYDILTDATGKVQKFSSDWHANTFAGGTVRKITRGMWAFDTYGDTLFMGIYPALLILISMNTILLIHMPLVGLFSSFMAVLYCAFSIWTSLKILAPGFRASAAEDTRVGAQLADMITSNATVKSFGAESREEDIFADLATQWRSVSQRAWMTADFMNMVRGMLRTTMLAGMVGLSLYLWSRGQATPGDIAFALTSFFVISGYMRDIGRQIAQLQRSVSEMEDIIHFHERDDEVIDKKDALRFKAVDGHIVFDNVSFSYDNQSDPIYEDFSLNIKSGEKVALVGRSGAGKSTFVKLVQRLYDVQSGIIEIDGQNIADVTQQSLRQEIALVPQDPVLFHRSLADNIAYGRPGVTMDEIIDASKRAYAHDFIMGLPNGYNTLVGERGIKLSGGERQRVAIARAILFDASILILDEATSALDSVSEDYIQKALTDLTADKTTITIAHRLATIRSVDRILVFEDGRVIEQGAHEQLIADETSHYRKLYEMQTLGLIGKE